MQQYSEIKNFVTEIKEKLADTKIGEILNSSRFPYTYHHDWIRYYCWSLSRSDVASIFDELFSDEEEYEMECIRGAFAYIFLNHGEELVLSLIESEQPLELIDIYKKMLLLAKKLILNFLRPLRR